VNLQKISPNLPLAVVASEDQKFPEHHGFDVEAIEKAYALNQHSHRIHGASTISQQVAKNLFLWSGRSYFRKGLEAWFTVLIEGCWPKRRILEVYLNIAEFGSGIYGAEAAAQHFFHKSAARLTRSDAAVLAAVLPSPERYSVAAPSRYVQQRREWIMGQMQALGGADMLGEIDAYPGAGR
jgi:monofunctional biosynthetic peptidoglycan transglycosylase